MKFTTQQFRCCVLTFWKFLHLECFKFLWVPGHFLDLIPAPQLNQRSEQLTSYAFYRCWFPVCIRNLCKEVGTDHFLFRNSVTLFLVMVSIIFLMQNLNDNINFCPKTVVYYYLHNSDMPMTSKAGICKELFVLLSKNDTFSKYDLFFYG